MARREPHGFTLIELLVVIAIIAVLMGVLACRQGSGTPGRLFEQYATTGHRGEYVYSGLRQ